MSKANGFFAVRIAVALCLLLLLALWLPGQFGGFSGADADGDTLDDAWEAYYGFDPAAVQTDGSHGAGDDPDMDQLSNWDEMTAGADPWYWDSDGDFMSDGWEYANAAFGFNPVADDCYGDADMDGLLNGDEVMMWMTDPLNWDSDMDGVSDGEEVYLYGTDPAVWNDPGGGGGGGYDFYSDADGDGLSDGDEYYMWMTDPWYWDSDMDGLSDGDEVHIYGSSPMSWDSDMDMLSDAEESMWMTDPMNWDTDMDGVSDSDEIFIYGTCPTSWNNFQGGSGDSDMDGLSDSDEAMWMTDPLIFDSDLDGLSDGDEVYVHGSSPTSWDTDGDGLADGDEVWCYGTYPNVWDSDMDGVSDWDEIFVYGTSPTGYDSDGDGMPDYWEFANMSYGLNPASDDGAGDSDLDGLPNYAEFVWGTALWSSDTDMDGLTDGYEVSVSGTHPNCWDTDMDGVSDYIEEIWRLHHGLDEDCDNMDDGWELEHMLDPADPNDSVLDPDCDGLNNLEESLIGTDPHNPDTDYDQVPDGPGLMGMDPKDDYPLDPAVSRDTDGDGLPNEVHPGWATNWTVDEDDDGDGMQDEWESFYGFDPLVNQVDAPYEAMGDPDGDGLINSQEAQQGSNPFNIDTDYDGLSDAMDPRPLVWDDADADPDGDGLTLFYELLYGCDPAVKDDADSDTDGFTDFDERIAGTDPTDSNDRPITGTDGNPLFFTATIAVFASDCGAVHLLVGDKDVVLLSDQCVSFRLPGGVAHSVWACGSPSAAVWLSASFSSPQVGINDPFDLFSPHEGMHTAIGDSTFIALPVVTISPADRICFHSYNQRESVEAVVQPEEMPGTFSWTCGEGYEFSNASEPSTELSITPDSAGSCSLMVQFHAADAQQAVAAVKVVTKCALCVSNGGGAGDDDDEGDGDPETENGGGGSSHKGEPVYENPPPDAGTPLAVNGDDDDADAFRDADDTNGVFMENDLVSEGVVGHYAGGCCPCPEHNRQSSEHATLIYGSPRVKVWTDASKIAETTLAQRGQQVFIEGTQASTAVGGERLVWEWTEWINDEQETRRSTNVFTVLSLRVIGDMDNDGVINGVDQALQRDIAEDIGWCLPAKPNVLRKVRLVKEVGLAGGFTLTLTGDPGSLRIWSSSTPSEGQQPLLVAGQTLMSGINGATFANGDFCDLWIESISATSGELVYRYQGTGDAANLSCEATLKITVPVVDIDADSNNDFLMDNVNDGEDKYEDSAPGMLLTHIDDKAEDANQARFVRLSRQLFGVTGVLRLEKESGQGEVRAWANEALTTPLQLPKEWDLSQGAQPPEKVWFQGTEEGAVILRFSLVNTETISPSDRVRITVVPPASYSPGGGRRLAIWAPLRTDSNLNDCNDVGAGDAMMLELCVQAQGFDEVYWYADVTGDTDLNLGGCTPENYLNMREGGIVCVANSHGDIGRHYAVYAPHSSEGRQTILNWCAGQNGMTCIEEPPSSQNHPGYYCAVVESSWFTANWKTVLDANKAITYWGICLSGRASDSQLSVMEAAGGRWRIGFTTGTTAQNGGFLNQTLFNYMNGTEGDGLRRTAGSAYGDGSEYNVYHVRMNGNPWTTLCPAPIARNWLMPEKGFPDPGPNEPCTGNGWGCMIFDTYMSGNVQACQVVDSVNLSNARWFTLGAGLRGIGFDYNKTNTDAIWLSVKTSECTSEGAGGGRPVDYDRVAPNGEGEKLVSF